MQTRNGCIDLLRLSEREQECILEALERHSIDVAAETRADRRHRRYRYVVREGLVVQVDGANARYVVRPRNLSAGGISFLHGSFLYPGTPCIVTLETTDGENVNASGRIVRCRCVHGRTHEVAVQFSGLIDIENFVSLETARVKDPGDAPTADEQSAYPVAQILQGVDELRRLVSNGAPRPPIIQKLTEIVGMLRLDAS